MRRRHFLRLTTISAAAWIAEGCSNTSAAANELPYELGEDYFPTSVASGDPRPDSVILWTRVEDEDLNGEDIELIVQLSIDESFAESLEEAVTARADDDGCVKVRITELGAASTYYYRFVYIKGGVALTSRTGRTKTAPEAGADVPVRFAFVSCQDYIGRYYNLYRLLNDEEPDFIVHLGDYIYETTGDPLFQGGADGRSLSFDDEAGAIVFNEGTEDEYFAARSLDNYRQLYRIYRSDPALQTIHERYPVVMMWDDHEFTNDSHGATGTYFGGEVDEEDVERRKVANRAWFEYMPVDYRDNPDFRYDPSAAFPGDISIYRELRYGAHLHLLLTDGRTYRTDHPVAEDAFPGHVPITQAQLESHLGELPDWASPYLDDIDTYQGGVYGDALRDAAAELGYDAAQVVGRMSVDWINARLEDITGGPSPIDDPALERGIAYVDLGKYGSFGSLGSRSLVVKPAFDAYSGILFEESQGESEQVWGSEQEAWVLERAENSDATWKVLGNEYVFSQFAVDLTALGGIPEQFTKEFYLSLDFWEGHRNRRNVVLDRLADVENLVAVTGDIHAFAAGTPTTNDGSKKIVELVTSSISSATFGQELLNVVEGNPALADFSAAATLAMQADTILGLGTNPHLAWTDSTMHGYAVVDIDGEALECTFLAVEPETVFEDYAGREAELRDASLQHRFRVESGSSELYRELEGSWKRWDPETNAWV
jgi:alkaline phosphatase D